MVRAVPAGRGHPRLDAAQDDGVELMKKLRSEPDFQKLPVIVFSNTYLTNMVQEAWKAGATKCLSKANCTPKQVIEVVRSALSRERRA